MIARPTGRGDHGSDRPVASRMPSASTLTVRDWAEDDTGILEEWGLHLTCNLPGR